MFQFETFTHFYPRWYINSFVPLALFLNAGFTVWKTPIRTLIIHLLLRHIVLIDLIYISQLMPTISSDVLILRNLTVC